MQHAPLCLSPAALDHVALSIYCDAIRSLGSSSIEPKKDFNLSKSIHFSKQQEKGDLSIVPNSISLHKNLQIMQKIQHLLFIETGAVSLDLDCILKALFFLDLAPNTQQNSPLLKSKTNKQIFSLVQVLTKTRNT